MPRDGEYDDQADKETWDDCEARFQAGGVSDNAHDPGDNTKSSNAKAGEYDKEQGGIKGQVFCGFGEYGGPEAGGCKSGEKEQDVKSDQVFGEGNAAADDNTEDGGTEHQGFQADSLGQFCREEAAQCHCGRKDDNCDGTGAGHVLEVGFHIAAAPECESRFDTCAQKYGDGKEPEFGRFEDLCNQVFG